MNQVRSFYRMFIAVVAFGGLLLTPLAAPAAAQTMPDAQLDGAAVAAGTQQHPDGQITLAATSFSSRAPVQAGFARFGSWISRATQLPHATSYVQAAWQARVPAGTQLAVDLRGSVDGQQWSAWHTDLGNGTVVVLGHPVQYVQYRLRLWGSATASPSVHAVHLTPHSPPPDSTDTAALVVAPQQATAQNAAPTYRIRATRLGLVGYRTANGHIIQPRDWFVALPSWRSLSSLGGYEYQVRITYNGRSVVAPVWDVGPWNTRDNYWDAEREQYNDLQRGWPQDHAAYFDGYNGGYAEKGYVVLPTAIDVGDGVWWDGLGINDGIAWLDVTFLWLGSDPHAQTSPPQDPIAPPSSDPNAPEYMVDERGPAFTRNAASWFTAPCGEDGHALWTYSVTDTLKRENTAFWQPALPVAGEYDLYAAIPDCELEIPATEAARYLIQHGNGATEVAINQATERGWVHLGRYPFAADASGFVYLTNVAGDVGRAIWFDNIRWVPVRETASEYTEPPVQ